jgi:hypothetical protein
VPFFRALCNFKLKIVLDIFEKVDFDPPRPPEEKPPEVPEIPDTGFKLPGFEVPTPGFNWRTFDLAKSNPSLFLKIVSKVRNENVGGGDEIFLPLQYLDNKRSEL